MFKGPVGPQSGRTSRSQAEKIGTDPSGFKDGPAFDPVSGTPVTREMPKQEYKPTPMKEGGDAKPMNIPAPFTTK